MLFDEELYENFDTNYSCKRTANGSHHFHIMEFDDYIAGACFANESDAKEFEKMIPMMSPKPKAKDTKESRKADAEAKKAERKKRLQAWEEMRKAEFNAGLENCVKDCRRRGNEEILECMESVTTASGARGCFD